MPLSNQDAELALVSSIVGDVFADFDVIRDRIACTDFENVSLGIIYRAIESVYSRLKSVPDGQTLVAELTAMNAIEDVVPEILSKVIESESGGDLPVLMEHVLDASILRQGFAAVSKFGIAAKRGLTPPAYEALSDLRLRIDAIIGNQKLTDVRPIHQVVKEIIDDAEYRRMNGSPSGITFPLSELNSKLGIIEFGQLVVINAASSHGKSAFGYQWGEHVATQNGFPVGIVSLEIRDAPLVRRRLGADTGVGAGRIASGHVGDTDIAKLRDYQRCVANWPIHISSRPSRKIGDILRWMRGVVRDHGCKYILVDYIQLIRTDKPLGTRNEELEAIADVLQSFAIEQNVIVVAPSQIKRIGRDQDDKTPSNDDSRGSGGIIQSADLVFGLNREAAHFPADKQPDPNDIQNVFFRVSKNRNGPTPFVTIGWIPNLIKFVDIPEDGI